MSFENQNIAEISNIGSGVFITGTDTGVGKSIFTAVIALLKLAEGKEVAIAKPIQTGLSKDTDFLRELTGNKIPIFNTYDFSLASAPSVASSFENKKIETAKIISDIKNLEKQFDFVIVEGIGGIAVPIGPTYLVLDLIKDLNYPTIIVARPLLGTINHSVLTIEFARRKKINILGFVISGYDDMANDIIIKTAPEEICKVTGCKCLVKIPIFKKLNHGLLNEYIASLQMLSKI